MTQNLRKKSLEPLGRKASEISKNDTKLRKKLTFLNLEGNFRENRGVITQIPDEDAAEAEFVNVR